MSKFIYLFLIILCSCSTKIKNVSNNNHLSVPQIETKKEKEFVKYDITSDTYTLKLSETEPFSFSLKKTNTDKLYEKVAKEDVIISEGSQSPLININNSKINIEDYILNEIGSEKDKILNLKIAIDEVLRENEKVDLPDGSSIKEAFEKSFGNYFFDIATGDVKKLKQDEKKVSLLKFLQKQLEKLNKNSKNDDIEKFLQSLHIEKIEINKDTIFINGKSLKNFTYFDFGIWEQNLSIHYKGEYKLKEYFDLQDVNKHKFIPFIYENVADKIIIKENTPMIFTGFAFAGVKNKDKYNVFNGNAKLEIDGNNIGNIFFDFKDFAKFSFSDIELTGDGFKGGNFEINTKSKDYSILKKAQGTLNGNFYGKNEEVIESAGTFKLENKDKNYQVYGVFGLKKN